MKNTQCLCLFHQPSFHAGLFVSGALLPTANPPWGASCITILALRSPTTMAPELFVKTKRLERDDTHAALTGLTWLRMVMSDDKVWKATTINWLHNQKQSQRGACSCRACPDDRTSGFLSQYYLPPNTSQTTMESYQYTIHTTVLDASMRASLRPATTN